MIEPGMVVENPLKSEWGPGKVLRLEGSVAVVIFRDDPDRAPKRFKSEFLRVAKSQADPELDLIQVGAAGGTVARKTRTGARGARTHDAAEERAKLSWLGAQGDELWRAFQLVFGAYGKAFGSPALGHGGLSDGNEGVQWNSTLFPTAGERRVGVNLEGMTYDGWPIGRLISRELRNPTLPALVERLPDLSDVVIRWERDCWQASSRIPIDEQAIEPSPMPLSALTTSAWHQMLRGAQSCLRPEGGSFKRAQRTVTSVATGGERPGEISPHLMVHVQADSVPSWLQVMQAARARLQPIYDWAVERSAPA